jgi:pimeloyl-ACP methyl ester carboxylesterase
MRISRHFVDIGSRRVHYRRAGKGPPLLLAHQSPRSSAEYESLMTAWAEHFTCIAPDTPGFGQSDPLSIAAPTIEDYADALVDFLDALKLERVGAYGFHSGGIILVTALKRRPQRFSALGVGGYAVWTEAERSLFAESYLPPFKPSPYGEHLTWLWNRILEQTWFFPWFDARPETRLPAAHDDPARTDAIVREMLDSGDAYRLGYGAVLAARRDIPPPGAATPPVLITAYDADPLQAHIDRLGAMPANWSARKVATPAEQETVTLEFLRRHPAPPIADLPEAEDEGFLAVEVPGFEGLIHWRGNPASGVLNLHAPGRSVETLGSDGPAIDLPGHGLSDPWRGNAPTDWKSWERVVEAARAHFGLSSVQAPPLPAGDPARLFPDLSPDRFGAYLTRAWQIVRARHFFDPWYEANAAHARDFDPAALTPERLAVEHRELIRASAAQEYLVAARAAKGGS